MGNICTTVAKERQDQDQGNPMHNHSQAKSRPRLCKNTAQQRQDKDLGIPVHNHSPVKARQRLGES